MKVVKNSTPCCNAPAHIKHSQRADDAVFDKPCHVCGRVYEVSFENIELRGCEFRLVKWELKVGAGGRPLEDSDV